MEGCPCRPAADRLCYVAFAPVGDQDFEDSGKHRTCRWTSGLGCPRRSKEAFRDLTCRLSSCLLGGAFLNTAHPAVDLDWTRRWYFRRKKNSAYHFTKRILTVDNKVAGEMFCGVVRTIVLAADSESTSSECQSENDTTTTWLPSCRFSMKKSLRPAAPTTIVAHHSAVRGS